MSRDTDDTPEILTAIRASWEADAATYDQLSSHGRLSDREQWAWRRVLGQAFDPVRGEQPLRILDVGTGTGVMALLLANMGNAVTAVDLAPAMLARAREKAEQLGVPITLLEGRADRLPVPEAAFDVVFSRHLLWTLPDPKAAFREWARVVRPGGMVAVADGWWGDPSRQMRIRRMIGSTLRRALAQPDHRHPGYDAIRERLPLADGLSPYSARYHFGEAGLERIRVRSLAAIRAAERAALPRWKRIDQARHTWLATGYRPE